MPLANPETVTGDVADVPVNPPGEDVAVYVVIVAPPLLVGAVNVMLALAFPFVAVPIVGIYGTLAITALVAFEFAATDDTLLVAVTTHRIV